MAEAYVEERRSISQGRSVMTATSPCQATLVVGIVLREVAAAIDVEWGEEADAY
jgi:hypothetical protein